MEDLLQYVLHSGIDGTLINDTSELTSLIDACMSNMNGRQQQQTRNLHESKEFRGIGQFIFMCKHTHVFRVNPIQIRNLISLIEIHSTAIDMFKQENTTEYKSKYYSCL